MLLVPLVVLAVAAAFDLRDREIPDSFALAETIISIAERLLSSHFENYVVIALDALQIVVAEVGPACARVLAKIDDDPCAVSTREVLKIYPILNDLSRVNVLLQGLFTKGHCPDSITARRESILRRIGAIWRL